MDIIEYLKEFWRRIGKKIAKIIIISSIDGINEEYEDEIINKIYTYLMERNITMTKDEIRSLYGKLIKILKEKIKEW